MRILLCTAGVAMLASPMNAAVGAVLTLGGPLSQNCYEAAKNGTANAFAIDACTRALQEEALSPADQAATFVNRGIVHMTRNRATTADADFDSALAIDPQLADAYLNKGFLRIRSGKGREALAMIQQGLDLGATEKAVAWFGRGVAYEQMGDYAKAYRDFQRARELAPDWNMPSDYLASYQVSAR